MAEPRTKSGTAVVTTTSQRERVKSLKDIYEQRDRIAAGSPERRELAARIAGDYVQNIKNTPEYAFDSLRLSDRQRLAMEAARQRGYTTAAQANADERLTRLYGRYTNDFFNEYLNGVRVHGQFGRGYPRSVYARKNRR